MLLCVGCEWHMKKHADFSSYAIRVDRYDALEIKFLKSCDYSALQKMNIDYPIQTHILIEDLLAIGKVDDPDVNTKFLYFFQDSTLQNIIEEVGKQYGNMDDVNKGLSEAFMSLKALIPDIKMPAVYSQIGALNQSIIVSGELIGICLDKYLGCQYPLYADYYPDEQLKSMKRSMIVPDCVAFYLLSHYPLSLEDTCHSHREIHRAKIEWIVNKVTKKKVFTNKNVKAIDKYMKANKSITVDELLSDTDFTKLAG